MKIVLIRNKPDLTQDKLGVAVIDNYREIQPLNGREIKLYSSDAAELETVASDAPTGETGEIPASEPEPEPAAPEPEVGSEPEPEGESGALTLTAASALALTLLSL